MKTMKKMIAAATLLLMFGNSTKGFADQYQQYAGGGGYLESRTAPNLAPAIALGAIALVAIIAVAVQNSNNGHGHAHN